MLHDKRLPRKRYDEINVACKKFRKINAYDAKNNMNIGGPDVKYAIETELFAQSHGLASDRH